jgi:DNA-binding MarR family transcriptional regulator
MSEPVMIELTAAQLAQVAMARVPRPDLLPSVGTEATADRCRKLANDPRLSAALIAGMLVLSSLPRDGDVAVTELARTLQMSASTTHRYLATLLALGLVDQDAQTRRYRIVSATA